VTHRALAASFLALALLGGCDGEPKPAPATAPVHEHHAPHGGALQVLGEEAAHVELVLESATGKLTAYVLDGEAEKSVRIAQDALELEVTLPGGDAHVVLAAVANELTGETVGDTSQFEGASERLRGAARFEGVLESVTARGVKFDRVRIGYPQGNEGDKAAPPK
jgi:hypothetical protein